jgi:hypothetical protein
MITVDTALDYLNKNQSLILFIGVSWCPHCRKATEPWEMAASKVTELFSSLKDFKLFIHDFYA